MNLKVQDLTAKLDKETSEKDELLKKQEIIATA